MTTSETSRWGSQTKEKRTTREDNKRAINVFPRLIIDDGGETQHTMGASVRAFALRVFLYPFLMCEGVYILLFFLLPDEKTSISSSSGERLSLSPFFRLHRVVVIVVVSLLPARFTSVQIVWFPNKKRKKERKKRFQRPSEPAGFFTTSMDLTHCRRWA